MLFLENITYIHPNKDLLFHDISLSIDKNNKIAFIGNNGMGKSTLLKIISGELQATSGLIKNNFSTYYVPQVFGQYNQLTIAQALQVEDKINALRGILEGNATETNFTLLNDDWTIEERCNEALATWQLAGLDLTQKMNTLSGGQKTKVFLAGISIHQAELLLLDEPSNHLDTAARSLLYHLIESTSSSCLLVSHDRKLLNLLPTVYELSQRGITVYGGNYDFYAAQKLVETDALSHDLKTKEKALRKAKEVEREATERQQKLDARGKRKQEKAGLPTIMMNTLKNKAEKSTAKLKGVHTEKISTISQELSDLRKEVPDLDKMKFGFHSTALHRGKVLFEGHEINFGYTHRLLWRQSLNLQFTSGDRLALKGLNGSGKTTLIKIIRGDLTPTSGKVYRAAYQSIYIDQDYSLIDNRLSIYEQAQQFNTAALQEHEIKIRLTRFLFSKANWSKSCSALSGGEKMRLMLCCLTISHQAPDMIVLDEPTNNLDMQNINILTAAINEYQGALLVVSHDISFLDQIAINRTIHLSDDGIIER